MDRMELAWRNQQLPWSIYCKVRDAVFNHFGGMEIVGLAGDDGYVVYFNQKHTKSERNSVFMFIEGLIYAYRQTYSF